MRAVVGQAVVAGRPGGAQGQPERHGGGRGEHGAGGAPAAAGGPHEADEGQRDDDGELHQDGQGPQVLHGGRVGEHAGEPVAAEREAPVEDLAEGGEDVAPEPRSGAHPQHHLEDHHQRHGEDDGRQDALGPVLPQPPEVEAAVLGPLGQRQRPQQEPGQGQEAGDAQEAARTNSNPWWKARTASRARARRPSKPAT